jgi:hypothetical protein
MEVLDLAYRQYSHIEMVLGYDIGYQVGGDRQPIEDEGLDVL